MRCTYTPLILTILSWLCAGCRFIVKFVLHNELFVLWHRSPSSAVSRGGRCYFINQPPKFCWADWVLHAKGVVVVGCRSMNSLPGTGPCTCCNTHCCFHTRVWRSIYALGSHVQGLMEQILYFGFTGTPYRPDCSLKARFCPSCYPLQNSALTCCASSSSHNHCFSRTGRQRQCCYSCVTWGQLPQTP